MSRVHWSDFYVAWLRSRVPELGEGPVYIRSYSEIHEWMRLQNTVAYAESAGDLKIKSLLIERDEWQGRGHFIAVSGNWDSMPEAEQLAVLLHELAHSLCAYDSRMQTLPESEFGEFETILLQPGGRDELLSRFDLKPLDDLREDGNVVSAWIVLPCVDSDSLRHWPAHPGDKRHPSR